MTLEELDRRIGDGDAPAVGAGSGGAPLFAIAGGRLRVAADGEPLRRSRGATFVVLPQRRRSSEADDAAGGDPIDDRPTAITTGGPL